MAGLDLIAGEYRRTPEPISEIDMKRILKADGKFIRPVTKEVYGNDNVAITVDTTQVWEIVKEYPKTIVIRRDTVEFRVDKMWCRQWEVIEGR